MRYVSTRGRAPELGFADVLLAGLASDGGLYVPSEYPALPDLAAAPDYASAAAAVMAPFVGDELGAGSARRRCAATPTPRSATRRSCRSSRSTIGTGCSSCSTARRWHSRTSPCSSSAACSTASSTQRGERITIVGATSGDTGSAAIAGVKDCANVDIVILYPAGRTSDVQRRQMTTVDSPNVHAVAIEGTFDDCQDLVKAMFADAAFRDELRLSAVNSINWARVMAQIVYYATAAAALGGPITVCVPTGNFGNVLAGWIARRMGAPIADFIVASNANDILTRFVNDGDMSTREVVPTLSPSMDIQVSSNFERLLFEINGRDGGMTAEQLRRFRATGSAGDRGRPAGRVHRRARSGPHAATTPPRWPRSGASIGRAACWSTPTPRPAPPPPPPRWGDAGRPGRDARHRPPGQVPRRRRARHG